jgi:hypothetical protein
MGGLARICKLYGRMTVQQDGKSITYVWDYANDCAVPESEIRHGTKRRKESDKVKGELMRKEFGRCMKETQGNLF